MHRLARQIGLKQAMGMALSSEPISTMEAARLGLVNQIVPPGELLKTAQHWCDLILRGAPSAIRATKDTMMRGLDEASLADAIAKQWSYPAFKDWLASGDIDEGGKAFAEKRKPRWQG
jgi:crotonobetainyl-CoA hydratase